VARLLSSQGVGELILADDMDPHRGRIAGRVPADGSAGFSEKAWRDAVDTLHAVARALRDVLGMRVVFHHHAGTFIETPQEIARLLDQTDPELVGLLLDTGHAVYGRADPLDLLARHGERVRYVHLKDVRPAELEHVRTSEITMDEAWARGVFCPLGEGVVDFPRLIETLRRRGYSGWLIVEQDVVPDAEGRLRPDPFDSARRSRAYLREQAGV
jgi:inosose dehydratase